MGVVTARRSSYTGARHIVEIALTCHAGRKAFATRIYLKGLRSLATLKRLVSLDHFAPFTESLEMNRYFTFLAVLSLVSAFSFTEGAHKIINAGLVVGGDALPDCDASDVLDGTCTAVDGGSCTATYKYVTDTQEDLDELSFTHDVCKPNGCKKIKDNKSPQRSAQDVCKKKKKLKGLVLDPEDPTLP